MIFSQIHSQITEKSTENGTQNNISPNQRSSYKAATTRTSELIPPWPEESKEALNKPTDL